MPLISICIPTYKRLDFLIRLLDSIASQRFTDFEVVISDDSPDDGVLSMLHQYQNLFPIRFRNNPQSLGTPANWNAAIGMAQGEWIKLMHDDDWFSTPHALAQFAKATETGKKFIFSDYRNEAGSEYIEKIAFSKRWKKRLLDEPMTLLAYNVIGPPSTTLIHRSVTEKYDETLKWRVDMEYYIRVLQSVGEIQYLDLVLVEVGISESQVTKSCLYVPSVELPEGRLLLQRYGIKPLQNILVYDAWWRLLRNMKILSPAQLLQFAPDPWPELLLALQKDLAEVPRQLLQLGIFSKTYMALSWWKNQSFFRKFAR